MTLPPVATVHLFAGERDALLDLLAGHADDEWWRPTVRAGWTVHDLTLHLLAVDCQQLATGPDRFFEPPAEQRPRDRSEWSSLVAHINQRNDSWVDATRRLSPCLLRELLTLTGNLLAAYWPTIDLNGLGPSVNWAGPAPAPRWLHVAREYTERWTHQQHIRHAVGKPGLTEPRWLAPVLDTFARALPHTLRDTPAADDTGVGLVISGEAGGSWWAVRDGEHWAPRTESPPNRLATVTLDQDVAWRLFTRDRTLDDIVLDARIDGDTAVGRTVLGMVAIIA